MLAESRNEQKTRLIYENELEKCIYGNFSLVLQNRTCLYVSVSVVRMNIQILQRKEVLLKSPLKYHVLKFQIVL